MKLINLEFAASPSEVLGVLSDNEYVNKNVNFDEKRGKPLMKIHEKNGKVKITCELLGRPTKDNGFIVGTYFRGRLTEKNGATKLKGFITTAPIYHAVLAVLLVVFVLQCIKMNGFSVIPLLLIVFDIFMFKDEFRKQGYISRYLYRAARKIQKNKK